MQAPRAIFRVPLKHIYYSVLIENISFQHLLPVISQLSRPIPPARSPANFPPQHSTMSDHQYKFNVTMTCGGCSGAVERVLKKLEGK